MAKHNAKSSKGKPIEWFDELTLVNILHTARQINEKNWPFQREHKSKVICGRLTHWQPLCTLQSNLWETLSSSLAMWRETGRGAWALNLNLDLANLTVGNSEIEATIALAGENPQWSWQWQCTSGEKQDFPGKTRSGKLSGNRDWTNSQIRFEPSLFLQPNTQNWHQVKRKDAKMQI